MKRIRSGDERVDEKRRLRKNKFPIPGLFFILFSFVSQCEDKYSTNLTIKEKNGPNLASFCLFSSFAQHRDKYSTNLTVNDTSIDGVLGTRTLGGMMEGADKSTDLLKRLSFKNF